MGKAGKKVIVNFHLEKEIYQQIEKIIKDPYSTFENKAQLMRYCIKQQLPLIKKEMDEQTQWNEMWELYETDLSKIHSGYKKNSRPAW